MRVLLVCVFVLRLVWGDEDADPDPFSICGPEKELSLKSHGEDASHTISLIPPGANDKHVSVCRLKVTAPKTHVVNLQFLEQMDNISSSNGTARNETARPSCVMSIYLPDNTKAPFWKGDPCSADKMTDVDLLTSEFKILWTPPKNHSTVVLEKTIVLTAVGSGPFCKDAFQHTCMRIGRIPMLCISDHLLCDGIQNCPKSSTNSDEDPKMCKTAKNAWETFVVELVKKYRPEEAGLKPRNATDEGWYEWQLFNKTHTTVKPKVVNETHSASESISAMLNKYGPWGYLMMGLLICGTVLFFCGLWECCCKRPKPEGDPPPQNTPTTVLVMNCENTPPQYEDLPPSYSTLFPVDEGRYTSLSEEPEEEKNEEGVAGGSGITVAQVINGSAETSQDDSSEDS